MHEQIPGDAHVRDQRAPAHGHEGGGAAACAGHSLQQGGARPGDGSQVKNQRRSTKLEQGVHQDQAGEEGAGDSVLLW